MPKYIDAEKLEKDGWSASRTYQQDAKTMVYETKKMTDFPTADVPERNVGDTISRQAAIDSLMNHLDADYLNGYSYLEELKHLPSAQPEIIRCKDCKWYGRADKRRFYRGMDCLQNRIDTIIPDKDFCSRAERREE